MKRKDSDYMRSHLFQPCGVDKDVQVGSKIFWEPLPVYQTLKSSKGSKESSWLTIR